MRRNKLPRDIERSEQTSRLPREGEGGRGWAHLLVFGAYHHLWVAKSEAMRQSRRSSLMLVFERVWASTFLTITAQ